ncbi:MAG: pitrilysin family protein [Rikenellaceae bacterium]
MTNINISLQEADVHQACNGVKIYTLPSEEFDVLRVSFVFSAGTIQQKRPFSATSTANLLCEGSANMSSSEIAERLDYYGSFFDVNVDRDYVYINFCSLSKFVEPTLEVASEIILRPTFPERELETYRLKRKQRLAVERAKVETKAREEFAKSLFGADHPYGVSASEAEYDNLRREDLLEIYSRCYCAESCFVVCSGRVDKREMALIESIASQLTSRGSLAAIELPVAKQRSYYLLEQAEAVQSSIRVGRYLFTRSHPDFLGMQVVATILGGYFGSRLMQSLREQRGYTYGVMAAMVNFAQGGYLAVATQVGVEVTSEALELIYEEIERLSEEMVPEEELDMVRKIMIGEMMRILDGPFGVADVTIENILCGDKNSSIRQSIERIELFTPEDIQNLARKYLPKDDLVTVVVGKI